MKSGIYLIENPKGKVYIGQSTNIKNRIHKYKKLLCIDQPLLYNSLIKYGFKNHKIIIVCLCDNVNDLNELERFYINIFNSNNKAHGLNLTTGGQDYFFILQKQKLK